MHRLIAVVIGAVWSFAASAQSALQCVDPDVVNAFVLASADGSAIEIGTEKPAELTGHEAPPEFAWIGTRKTDRDTRAAFKTRLAPEAALDAFLASLGRAGFGLQARDDDPGFQLMSPPLTAVACRDGEAGVVIVRDSRGARFVTVAFTSSIAARNCEEVLATPRSRSRGGFAYIPSLSLPSHVAISSRAGAMPTGMGSGSGEIFRSMLEVEGVGSMSGLVETFDAQLRAQGWAPDAHWSGSLSAGSTWTRETDGLKLAGKLEVRALAIGAHHHLEFKLQAIG